MLVPAGGAAAVTAAAAASAWSLFAVTGGAQAATGSAAGSAAGSAVGSIARSAAAGSLPKAAVAEGLSVSRVGGCRHGIAESG